MTVLVEQSKDQKPWEHYIQYYKHTLTRQVPVRLVVQNGGQ